MKLKNRTVLVYKRKTNTYKQTKNDRQTNNEK